MLSSNDLQEVFAQFMTDISSKREPLGAILKSQLRQAVDDIDVWVEDNQASFNAAIAEPARTELTMNQKVRIFFAVVKKRLEK